MTDEASRPTCANCGQPLDAADKFCRECGLPTMRHAAERKRVPAAPPDTGELRRALNVQPEPRPFAREAEPPPPPETTGDVVRATSPTQAVQMASSTLVMLFGLMLVLAVAGVILLIVALR
jgi:hypothetical protein